VSPVIASQFSVRIDEPAALPAASARLFELSETHQLLSYRVVVHGIRPEFDPAVVLGSIADLFRRGDEKNVDLGASMPFGRAVRDAAAAARLADLLTTAGCQCAIDINFAAPLPDASVSSSWHGPSWRMPARITGAYRTAGAFLQSWSPALRARLQVGAIKPIALAIGVVATIGVLLVTLSGTSSPVYATRAGDATVSPGGNPLPPAVDWSTRSTVAAMRRAPGNEALLRAKTSLGEVTLEKNSHLKWNGAVIRELRVESPPSIVPRRGRGKPEPAIGEFSDEVALVIDTGEPRSAFCQANKSMLVVLSRLGAAHMHDIPGNCAELETVAVDRERMLLHFYDQAAPSIAYQGGQILRTLE
jgi:hypothetical protein